jgi:hypothetical protein
MDQFLHFLKACKTPILPLESDLSLFASFDNQQNITKLQLLMAAVASSKSDVSRSYLQHPAVRPFLISLVHFVFIRNFPDDSFVELLLANFFTNSEVQTMKYMHSKIILAIIKYLKKNQATTGVGYKSI